MKNNVYFHPISSLDLESTKAKFEEVSDLLLKELIKDISLK